MPHPFTAPPALYAGDFVHTADSWDDLQCSIESAGGGAALTLDDYGSTGFKVRCLRSDQQDSLYLAFQLPHGWKRGSEVRPHIHVIPLADPASTQVLRFSGAYAWAITGQLVPTSGWTAFESLNNIAHGDIGKEMSLNLFSVTPDLDVEPARVKDSSVLLVKLTRGGTGDTYTTAKTGGLGAANVAVLSIDAHVIRESRGTPNFIPPP